MKEYSNEVIEVVKNRLTKRNDFYCDLNSTAPKYYVLGMLPYPSGNAHMGHMRVYTIPDVMGRYKKLKGFNILNPLGWDSFGLPAENAAIKNNANPKDWTMQNIHHMKYEQLMPMNWSFDWTKEINSCDPEYYRWSQWIFLQFYKNGKAYRANQAVNWCPVDETVLAEEQVIDGKCWRDGAKVEKKLMEQWYLRLTDYSEQLWDDIDKLKNWAPEAVSVQKNWINKSEGSNALFNVPELDADIEIFTTCIDTIFGVSALVIAPEHPLVAKMNESVHYEKIQAYAKVAFGKSNLDRISAAEKTGIFTGFYAVNPVNGEQVPVYIADYVLADYATGAVMVVPAHDERDYIFAQNYNLPLKHVIEAELGAGASEKCLTGGGYLINSGKYNGLTSAQARAAITADLVARNLATHKVNYSLRDWSVSRQRYWGCPIPMIHCPKCGTVPVPEDQLPVLLPEKVSFKNGKADISDNADFLNVNCPNCGAKAQREKDTLDTFVCSSWYAYRYISPKDDKQVFDSALVNKWMPIDYYVGGLEHAAQHMIYFRFFTKFFKDIGLIDFDEPVDYFFCNGMVLKDGHKMSKSKGNVVEPVEMLNTFGPDAMRLYIMSDTPAEYDFEWNDSGLKNKFSFIKRTHKALVEFLEGCRGMKLDSVDELDFSNKTILTDFYKSMSDFESSLNHFSYNNAVAQIHKMSNILCDNLSANYSQSDKQILFKVIKDFLVLAGIYMPYFAEYLLNEFYGEDSIYLQTFPVFNKLILETSTVTITVTVNGKKAELLEVAKNLPEADIKAMALENSNVAKRLEGKEIVKTIYVPNKVFNIVVK